MVLDLAAIHALKLRSLALRQDITETCGEAAATLKQIRARCQEWDTTSERANLQCEKHKEIHAAARVSGPKTLRFQAQLKGIPVVVLVDSVSTHSFVSETKAEESKLALEPIEPFFILIANGERVRCHAKCADVQLGVQGTTLAV
ncbi:unnamed protein product [Linum trigynum]|uniref:Uncharacterized protein n=1 Tax=Linum trigynum TaxID=586398 RepID=A0AAV2EBB3_9ROSI